MYLVTMLRYKHTHTHTLCYQNQQSSNKYLSYLIKIILYIKLLCCFINNQHVVHVLCFALLCCAMQYIRFWWYCSFELFSWMVKGQLFFLIKIWTDKIWSFFSLLSHNIYTFYAMCDGLFGKFSPYRIINDENVGILLISIYANK